MKLTTSANGQPGETIRPTLIERINGALPIPYLWATLIVAVLLGPLGFYIVDVLSYLDIGKGTSVFLSSSLDHYTFSQLIGNNVIYPALIFYCAFMIRYMRRRIAAVEEVMVKSSPDWQGPIRKSFGRISRTGPALVVALIIFVLSYPVVAFQISNNHGLAQLYFAITYPLFFFGDGTFIWMYVSSLWGLYRIGTEPLKLKPHTEDSLLGLGGFGRISMTLTVVFLIAVFFAIFEFSVFATAMPLILSVFFSGLLIMGGVCMFFLPLLNIHGRMLSEKEKLRVRNLGSIVDLISEDSARERGPTEGELKTLLVLEHEREQIQGIATWPFDAPIVKSLTAVVIGVIISISAHLLTLFLNI